MFFPSLSLSLNPICRWVFIVMPLGPLPPLLFNFMKNTTKVPAPRFPLLPACTAAQFSYLVKTSPTSSKLVKPAYVVSNQTNFLAGYGQQQSNMGGTNPTK